MSKFQSLMTASPLGLMYGSAGGFLSPENLVGRSNTKFPPDAATVAGLLLNANREQQGIDPDQLKSTLVVVGPFWAQRDQPTQFYVPISRHRVIDADADDEWVLKHKEQNGVTETSTGNTWHLNQCQWHRANDGVPAYLWQQIESWNVPTHELRQRGPSLRLLGDIRHFYTLKSSQMSGMS